MSAILALASIGLFASLLPQTSFVSRTSGEFVDAIGPVWPDWSVEQILDEVDVISEVRIWAAAGIDRGEAPIVASLLRPDSDELVRQVRFSIVPSNLLVPHIVIFPPYNLTPGEKLVLQLWVSKERDNHVIFGTSEHRNATPLTLNRQPTDHGPLAHEVIWRGTGWQTALEGSTPDRARLAAALAAAALAIAITVVSHPFVSRTLRNKTRKVRTAFLALTSRVQTVIRLSCDHSKYQTSPVKTSAARRGLYVFPWLIPAFAILHYLSNNLILFGISESIAVFMVTMVAVTITFVALRIILKSAAIAAVLTGLLGTAFFSYGHIYVALGDADHRYLLGLGVPIMLGLGALMVRHPNFARNMSTTLNVGSLALVLLPAYQIATDFYAGSPQVFDPSDGFPRLDERLTQTKDRLSRDQLRDVYYIILDRYPRSGSPPEFDNSKFVQELQRRGFYVAPQARSNYRQTIQSIPSLLNMRYVQDSLGQLRWMHVQPRQSKQFHTAADDHTVGQILKSLGYEYIHVTSGLKLTDTSRNADRVVDFAPSGTLLSRPDARPTLENIVLVSGGFTTALLRTTAATPFLSQQFQVDPGDRYDWLHPARTLAWLDFMKTVGRMEKPKFVFAHLTKPHEPYSFDRAR